MVSTSNRRIFVSHATEDVEFARKLKGALTGYGWKPFVASDDLDGAVGSGSWTRALDVCLDKSFAVVVVVTDAALTSRWVEYEWGGVHNDILSGRGGVLIPICVGERGPEELPRALRTYQVVDMRLADQFGIDVERIDKILDGATGAMGAEATVGGGPGETTEREGEAGHEERALDMTDPTQVARAVLLAYRSRDVGALHALCNAGNQEMLEAAPTESRKNSVFRSTSWRMQAVSSWDGEIHEVRVDGAEARALFNEVGHEEVAVVTLDLERGQWRFEDIHSPGRKSYESYGKRVYRRPGQVHSGWSAP